MHTCAKIAFILSSAVSVFGVTACQTIAPQAPTTQQIPTLLNQFTIQGKLGVKTPQQSGSAFFVWQQNQQNFDIELSGMLGIGKTVIQGKPGEVTLNSAKTGELSAETPEELLARATGWQAPITHMIDWVQAKPATVKAQIQKDPQQRIIHIAEDGWTVALSYNDQATLPNKLILQQQLETGKQNRITMLIQNR